MDSSPYVALKLGCVRWGVSVVAVVAVVAGTV